jgi:hypothetical protein
MLILVGLLPPFGLLAGCFEGPGFLKQGTSVQQDRTGAGEPVVVATMESNGVATGAIDPNSTAPQQINASDNSAIAGANIVFPPGALAIETEVSIKEGDALVTDDTFAQLGIDGDGAVGAPSVAVTSSEAIDATVPFTIALPIPDQSSLRGFALQDGLDNLVVLYKVTRVDAGGDFNGLIPRDEIEIDGGYAVVKSKYFGVYQAVITAKKVEAAVEVASDFEPTATETSVATDTETSVATSTDTEVDEPTFFRVYFTRGPAIASFGGDAGTKSGLRTWVPWLTPARVGQGSQLNSSIVLRLQSEE